MTNEAGDEFPHEIKIVVHVTVLGDEFLVETNVEGEVQLNCDRCGIEFLMPLKGELKSLFTSDRTKAEENDSGEIKWISPGDQELDVTQEVIDASFLSIPVKRLCKTDCRGLCPKCGADLNKKKCHCSEEEGDSRWDALKNITF